MARLVIMALILTLMTGCTFLEGLGLGGGPTVTGTVTYADTGIGVRSDVQFGSQRITTNASGQYVARLSKGPYSWTASVPFGTMRGSINVSDRMVLNIQIPAFHNWSRIDFNEMLVTPQAGGTVRWPTGKTVRYWVETPEQNSHIEWFHREFAKDAIREWATIVGHSVTFVEAASAGQADLVVRWDERSAIGTKDTIDAIGVCNRTWDPRSNHLVNGEIKIAYEQMTNRGLYRHEVGHCIGLGHSHKSTFVMHDYITGLNQIIRPEEERLAQLLYAIRPGTRPLAVAGMASEWGLDDVPTGEVIYNPDGTVTESIYTWAAE